MHICIAAMLIGQHVNGTIHFWISQVHASRHISVSLHETEENTEMRSWSMALPC